MRSRKLNHCLSLTILVVSTALVLVWVVGQIFRDQSFLTGLMFYFPTPVLVAGVVGMISTSKKWRRVYVALSAAPIAMLFAVENQWVRPTPPVPASTSQAASIRDPLRLVHWNICHGQMGWEKQWQHILSFQPDIVVLSEIPEPFDEESLIGFNVLTIDGMAVACHGSMTTSRYLLRGGVLDAYHVTCHLKDGPLELLIADMTSRISLPRDPFLKPFVQLLSEREIDVAVGDLNAPRRSLAFSNLPQGFRHGYDSAGSGWSYTWPVPIPVLAIDQCIVGPKLNPVHYKLDSTLLSDHRLQILDLEWTPEDPAAHAPATQAIRLSVGDSSSKER